MKKLTALLSAIVLGLTAAPAAVFAESSETITSEIQMGDVNGDGYIDASDATLVLRCYTLLLSEVDIADIPYYDNIVKYGDISGDGSIDCQDSSLILKKYVEYLNTDTNGDVNRDGVVDVHDAAEIFVWYHLASTSGDSFLDTDYEWKKQIMEYGDANCNGVVDVADASIVIYRYKYRMGLSDEEVMEEFNKICEEVKKEHL